MNAQAERINDDEVLDLTLDRRQWMYNQLTENGTKLPQDVAQQKLVMQLLDGMDKAALGKKRLKLEEKTVDAQSAAAGVMASILALTAAQRPFTIENPTQIREAPVLGSEVPDPVLVEGETSTVTPVVDFDTFMTKTSQEVPS